MKNKGLLFLLFFYIVNLTNAQTYFKAGYVITKDNDTLRGEIDYRSDITMSKVCRYRAGSKATEIKYSPTDINAYRFDEGKYYISKEISGTRVFLEFLIKGNMNIYYLKDIKGDHYFFEKENMGMVSIPYEEGIKYRNDYAYFYKSKVHIGLFNYYMQDAPNFTSRIEEIEKPDHRNLIKLAKDYHNITCKDGVQCIIYEKKVPILKCNFEALGGVVKYKNSDNIVNNKNNYLYGMLMHFWMPRANEKLYFRTGLLYSTFEHLETKEVEAVYKIPLQIEYIYPKGSIRPIMAFGVNIYTPTGYQSIALMGGLNIKLHELIYMGFIYDLDFNSNEYFPLLPKNLLSKSVSVGFQIKL